jgi:N-acetyl-gamma-glutamyl-phosphate reductase
MAGKIRIGVIGASGYTGADLVRLAARHPAIEIAALTANTYAGQLMAAVYPHLAPLNLPGLVKNEDVDWSKVDAVFCGLPHATSQEVIAKLPGHLKIIDMSADFRLRDVALYEKTYGGAHKAPELQKQAVYGLTEHYREAVKKARLACAAALGAGGAHRCVRPHHRCQVGGFRRGSFAEAECAVL